MVVSQRPPGRDFRTRHEPSTRQTEEVAAVPASVGLDQPCVGGSRDGVVAESAVECIEERTLGRSWRAIQEEERAFVRYTGQRVPRDLLHVLGEPGVAADGLPEHAVPELAACLGIVHDRCHLRDEIVGRRRAEAPSAEVESAVLAVQEPGVGIELVRQDSNARIAFRELEECRDRCRLLGAHCVGDDRLASGLIGTTSGLRIQTAYGALRQLDDRSTHVPLPMSFVPDEPLSAWFAVLNAGSVLSSLPLVCWVSSCVPESGQPPRHSPIASGRRARLLSCPALCPGARQLAGLRC